MTDYGNSMNIKDEEIIESIPKLTVKILEVEFFNDEFFEYLTEVNVDNKKIYNLCKRFHQFVNLHKALKAEFSGESVIFPETAKIFNEEYHFEKKIDEENINALENYLNEISANVLIYASDTFHKFFEIADYEQEIFTIPENKIPISNFSTYKANTERHKKQDIANIVIFFILY